jgi:hypothetical protein
VHVDVVIELLDLGRRAVVFDVDVVLAHRGVRAPSAQAHHQHQRERGSYAKRRDFSGARSARPRSGPGRVADRGESTSHGA